MVHGRERSSKPRKRVKPLLCAARVTAPRVPALFQQRFPNRIHINEDDNAPKDDRLPLHDVAIDGRRVDARGWVRLHFPDVADEAPPRCRRLQAHDNAPQATAEEKCGTVTGAVCARDAGGGAQFAPFSTLRIGVMVCLKNVQNLAVARRGRPVIAVPPLVCDRCSMDTRTISLRQRPKSRRKNDACWRCRRN